MSQRLQSRNLYRLAVLVVLATVLMPCSPVRTEGVPPPINYVELFLFRNDNVFNPGAFLLELVIILEDVTGVTAVTATTGDGRLVPLENGGVIRWGETMPYSGLADLKSDADGTWTIDITGSSPSTSTFNFSVSSLLDSDIFATPTGLTPANGVTDVPPNVVLTWNDPTGPATPDVLGVRCYALYYDNPQEVHSLDGSIIITDTSWKPPNDLSACANEYGVLYLNYDHSEPLRTDSLTVDSGAITWSNSPLVQGGHPAATPLFMMGSQTSVEFEVTPLCPADTNGDMFVNVTDLLALLAAWGPNPGHAADINGDGNVNVTDLLALLAAWGVCP